VTAGPGDETASAGGGHGRQRASHSDREQVIEVPRAVFVQDRLTMDELDVRVGRAFTARTYAELAVLTADSPAEPATAVPPRPAGNRARVWVTAVAFLIALISVAVGTGENEIERLAFVAPGSCRLGQAAQRSGTSGPPGPTTIEPCPVLPPTTPVQTCELPLPAGTAGEV
jgi:hypothetical protein